MLSPGEPCGAETAYSAHLVEGNFVKELLVEVRAELQKANRKWASIMGGPVPRWDMNNEGAVV